MFAGRDHMNWGLVLIVLVAFLPIYELVRTIRAVKRRETLLVVITGFVAAAFLGILASLFFWYLWRVGILVQLF
jgi:hypothetical protein